MFLFGLAVLFGAETDNRQQVLDLQKRGVEYNILKREVETNRVLYNELLQRFGG